MVNKVGNVNLIENSNGSDILRLINNEIVDACMNNKEKIEKIISKSIGIIRKIDNVPNKSETIGLLVWLRKNYLWAKNRGDKELNDFIDIIINNPIF